MGFNVFFKFSTLTSRPRKKRRKKVLSHCFHSALGYPGFLPFSPQVPNVELLASKFGQMEKSTVDTRVSDDISHERGLEQNNLRTRNLAREVTRFFAMATGRSVREKIKKEPYARFMGLYFDLGKCRGAVGVVRNCSINYFGSPF